MSQVSAAELLQFLTNGLYVIVFVVTAIHAVRHRARADLDIALLFGATAIIIGVSWLPAGVVGPNNALLGRLSSAILMTMPYLLLRLVDDYGGVPALLTRLAEAGAVVSVVLVFVVSQPYPLAMILPLVVYFVLLEIYDAVAFVRAAARSRGVTRRRMQAVAAGSFFLGFVVIADGLTAAAPALVGLWLIAAQLFGLLSGVAYLVGFAPPGWLRRAWQAPELRNALGQSTALVRHPDQDAVIDELQRACAAAVGAPQAVIDLWNPTTNTFSFRFNGKTNTYPANQLLAGQVLISQKPLFAARLATEQPGLAQEHQVYPVRSALLAPISAGKQRYGVVVVSSPWASIFAEDDLALVQFLANQMAVVLENRALVDETARERARAEALAVAEAERRRANEELEARVAERTAELQQALQELESFSYSVSHDLRAPLRTIDGFVHAFLEDFGEGLDPMGRDYLERTRNASQRMGQLIDGLLRLSRVTRSEMVRKRVDLSALARDVVDELRRSDPKRSATIEIADDLVGDGDEPLLRVALENLLGNAWKFTAKQPHARISFSAHQVNESPVYVIRDNGVGFDMAYADKLFGPFQRLHARDEFEGAGIGLATVQRIIRRHGGRIWGEGVVGQGATFSFSLTPRMIATSPRDGEDGARENAGDERHTEQGANLVG